MLAIVIAACNNSNTDAPAATASTFNLDSVKQIINATNANFAAAIKSGDSVAAASGYTSDAIIMPPNMASVNGRAAIVSFAAETSRMGPVTFKLVSTEVSGDDASVEEVGTYEVSDDKGTVLDKGKFICLWKKEDGKWKIYRDIFNSDLPPMPMPEPTKK